jgi:hypothetical protein
MLLDKLIAAKRVIMKVRMGRRLKHALYGSPPPPHLDPHLSKLERVFRSPPLTWPLTRAINLISPHCDFRPNERNRDIWEADQNGACWAEYEVLCDVLTTLPKRARILEIGPGLGRSLIFFSKKLGWENCELHAYEGDGKSTKYTVNGPRFKDSWCGTISEFKKVLDYNGIHHVTIHDASKITMTKLPAPFDLVYGFYNIGYHWSLEHFLLEVLTLIGPTGIAIFTVPRKFEAFEALRGLPYKIVAKNNIISGDQAGGLLILGPIHKSVLN